MARVLLVDPSDSAGHVMRAILSRGRHKCACVPGAFEAWSLVLRSVKVDLVFTETHLAGGEDGFALIKRLKEHPLLHGLPVVIYAAKGDRAAVKRGLDLHVQNFLIKPYLDEAVFAELDKCIANPWRNQLFEEEKSFCRLMEYTPERLHQLQAGVREAVDALAADLDPGSSRTAPPIPTARLRQLGEQAEAAGVWGVVEALNCLAVTWPSGLPEARAEALAALIFSGRLISHRLDDSLDPDDFSDRDRNCTQAELREIERWRSAGNTGQWPVLEGDRLRREVDALPGCPVIDSSAATFRMAATGHPSCINPLMDIVAHDPGLSTQLLIAANQMHPAGENDNIIEDPRLAVGILGEKRLESLAARLVQVESRHLNLPPALSWQQFWMFQTGVGRIARFACRYLEFYSMEPQARIAGMLHDIGKLVLLHLHPAGFRVILEHARQHGLSLAEAEQRFLGCTSKEVGVRLGERLKLARRYLNVLRWIDNPDQAEEDRNLVAIVSLARDLCRQNQVGAAGEPPLRQPVPLEETVEWGVLRQHLYPSFNARKFEQQVHAYCQQMSRDLSGQYTRSFLEPEED